MQTLSLKDIYFGLAIKSRKLGPLRQAKKTKKHLDKPQLSPQPEATGLDMEVIYDEKRLSRNFSRFDLVERSSQYLERGDSLRSDTGSSMKQTMSALKPVSYVPPLALPQRDSNGSLERHINGVNTSTKKSQLINGKKKGKLDQSAYRSKDKSELSIYQQVLNNIRFTKRSNSKESKSHSISGTPNKNERSSSNQASRLSSSGLIAANELRSKITFAVEGSQVHIFDSGAEESRLSSTNIKGGTVQELSLVPEEGSELTSNRKRAYKYRRSMERSYSELFEKRTSQSNLRRRRNRLVE